MLLQNCPRTFSEKTRISAIWCVASQAFRSAPAAELEVNFQNPHEGCLEPMREQNELRCRRISMNNRRSIPVFGFRTLTPDQGTTCH